MLTSAEKNSKLRSGNIGYSYFESKGITTFQEACEHVASLPYGRNSNKADVLCILIEEKGTCSTKHVFLQRLAEDLDLNRVKLFIGVFRMNKFVFPKLDEILGESGLSYIPEAHNYLRVDGTIHDYTMPGNSAIQFEEELMFEQEMSAVELNDFKVPFHREFLQRWIETNNVPYSLDEVWDIRERCIQRLSEEK
jgi:hypothetical protein